ncbi:MAG: trypsin-like peptidase domain-containing protein [Spirochaetota bacterium]
MNRSVRPGAPLFALLVAALLWGPSPAAVSQSPLIKAYADYADSVVMVRRDLLVDPDLISNRAEFAQWERSLAEPVQGSYIPFSSGSGFYVSEEGHILTNRHVVEEGDEELARELLFQAVGFFIANDISDSGMTTESLSRVIDDWRRITRDADITFRVLSRDNEPIETEVLYTDDEFDLALLSTQEGTETRPLPFKFETDLVVGEEVFAIGYPLGSVFDFMFEEIQPTLSQGIISAIRRGEWSIQHTAAINPGSSGGPLLGPDRRVLGVIVGTIENADQLQFAISMKDVLDVLDSNGWAQLIESNRLAGVRTGVTLARTDEGEVILGTQFSATSFDGMEFSVNGEPVGTTPLEVTLEPGRYELELVGDLYSSVESVVVREDQRVGLIYSPPLSRNHGSLVVDAVPDNVAVLLDGERVGSAPLTLESVPTGTYTVGLEQDGYFAQPVTVDVKRNEQVEVSVEMQSATLVRLPGVPDGAIVTLAGPDGIELTDSGAELYLPDGEWTLTVEHDYFTNREVVFSVPVVSTVDLTPIAQRGSLVVRNLRDASVVTVKGDLYSGEISGGSAELPAGRYTVTVTTPDYATRTFQTGVQPDEVRTVAVGYERSREWRDQLMHDLRPTITGTALIAGGFALNWDEVAIPASGGSYGLYQVIKYGTIGMIVAGVGLEVWGVIRLLGR